jgi:hypothetical protein
MTRFVKCNGPEAVNIRATHKKLEEARGSRSETEERNFRPVLFYISHRKTIVNAWLNKNRKQQAMPCLPMHRRLLLLLTHKAPIQKQHARFVIRI